MAELKHGQAERGLFVELLNEVRQLAGRMERDAGRWEPDLTNGKWRQTVAQWYIEKFKAILHIAESLDWFTQKEDK